MFSQLALMCREKHSNSKLEVDTSRAVTPTDLSIDKRLLMNCNSKIRKSISENEDELKPSEKQSFVRSKQAKHDFHD